MLAIVTRGKTTLWVREVTRRRIHEMKTDPKRDTVDEIITGLILISRRSGHLAATGKPKNAASWRAIIEELERERGEA